MYCAFNKLALVIDEPIDDEDYSVLLERLERNRISYWENEPRRALELVCLKDREQVAALLKFDDGHDRFNGVRVLDRSLPRS